MAHPLLCTALAVLVSTGAAEVPPGFDAVAGARCLYRLESPSAADRDAVRLATGEVLIGRAHEWAGSVAVYDAGGRARVVAEAGVLSIDHRRRAASAPPSQPDLTVAFVERGPPRRPSTVHVLNAGGAAADGFDYRVLLDERVVKTGRVDDTIPPRGRTTFACELPADGAVELRIELDGEGRLKESARWNNVFVEPLIARPIRVLLQPPPGGSTATRNLVDTWSHEDAVQYHFRMLNAIVAATPRPAGPGTVSLRIRVSGIDAVAAGGAPASAAPEVASVLWTVPPDAAGGGVDREFMVKLGQALGLVDLRGLATPVSQLLVRDSAGDYVQREFLAPAGLMSGGLAATLSAGEAGLFDRLTTGGAASPGEHLHGLPGECALLTLDANGRPLAGVDVAVFQRSPSGAPGAGLVPPQELIVGQSDPQGRFVLPARDAPRSETPRGYKTGPNPFGVIARDGSNGLFMVRLRHPAGGAGPSREEFHFVSIGDFNDGFARGFDKAYDLPLFTRFSRVDVPAAPGHTRVRYDDDQPRDAELKVIWPTVGPGQPVEYRVYACGDRASSWRLAMVAPPPEDAARQATLQVLPKQPFAPLVGSTSMGTFYAVSGVAENGDVGRMAPPVLVPRMDAQSVKMAIHQDLSYVSLEGPSRFCLLRFARGSIPHEYGIRTTNFPGYEPWCGGLWFDHRGRLIITDPHHHQVGWYERGDLVKLVGQTDRRPEGPSSKPGEFNTPSDVAVDELGRVYVADTGNNRVQILDDEGRFVDLFKEGGEDAEIFDKPTALGTGLGKLCVTDSGGTRIQVFDISGGAPRLERVLRGLRNADRALPGGEGFVYALGKLPTDEWTVAVYARTPPDGGEDKPERHYERTLQGFVRGPRGLYPDGSGFALFVTEYPFIIHRIQLQ